MHTSTMKQTYHMQARITDARLAADIRLAAVRAGLTVPAYVAAMLRRVVPVSK